MADPPPQPQRQLSLVPYASESHEIVLRHGNAIVVFDPESRQLSLHGNIEGVVESGDCPYCHRPLRESTSPRQFADDSGPSSSEEQTFVDPDYFRLLAHSIPGSSATSRPTSPLKQLPPLRSNGSRNVSAASGPPSGAEFVGSAPMPQSTEHGIRGSSFLPNYFKSFFTEKRELGRGGRGVVLLVEHFLDDVSLGEFACKRIPVGNDHTWLEKVLIEVQLLQRLNHQNLVSYRHVWLEDAQIINFGPSVPCIFILQQYCNAGDLHEYVIGSMRTTSDSPANLKERMRRRSKGQDERLSDTATPRSMHFDEIFSFFRDITSGLHHLHTNGYIHRDLKPSNCLLHRSGGKLTAHVSDFGEVQATNEKRNNTGATGTISYCAPEVLLRKSPDGSFGDFTTKSDIFSLGMIVYFMCFGRLPYPHADNLNDENEDLDQLRAEVSAWTGFDDATRSRMDLPEKLYKFLKKLLSPNPQERPSTEQILQAIKAGGGIDDIDIAGNRSPELGDMSSRISSVDSPKPQKMGTRTNTNPLGIVRPGLSQLSRNHSGDLVHARTPTPRRFSRDDQQTPTPATSTVALRRAETTPAQSPNLGRPGKQMPRLMLPPPPTLRSRILHPHPSIILTSKVFFFGLKLFTFSHFCAPYAGNPWVLYPLMSLALLDFTFFQADWAASFILLGLHFMAAFWAERWECLCNNRGRF